MDMSQRQKQLLSQLAQITQIKPFDRVQYHSLNDVVTDLVNEYGQINDQRYAQLWRMLMAQTIAQIMLHQKSTKISDQDAIKLQYEDLDALISDVLLCETAIRLHSGQLKIENLPESQRAMAHKWLKQLYQT